MYQGRATKWMGYAATRCMQGHHGPVAFGSGSGGGDGRVNLRVVLGVRIRLPPFSPEERKILSVCRSGSPAIFTVVQPQILPTQNPTQHQHPTDHDVHLSASPSNPVRNLSSSHFRSMGVLFYFVWMLILGPNLFDLLLLFVVVRIITMNSCTSFNSLHLHYTLSYRIIFRHSMQSASV